MRWTKIFLIALIAGVVMTIALAAGETKRVQVKEARLRSRPHFLGSLVADAALSYGDEVTVLETKGAWVKVKCKDGSEGWLHSSALTERKIKRTTGGPAVGVKSSGEELALAAKGFNKQVEKEFRRTNRKVNFARVDRMEKEFNFTIDELREFLIAGGVTLEEGGAE